MADAFRLQDLAGDAGQYLKISEYPTFKICYGRPLEALLRNQPLPHDHVPAYLHQMSCLNTLQAQAQEEGNGLNACVEKMEQMLRLVTTSVCA